MRYIDLMKKNMVNNNKIKSKIEIKCKKGNNKYKILDLMKKNMEKNNNIKTKVKIKKLINYFLKEF